MHIHMYIRDCVCMYVCMYECVSVYMYVCVHMVMYVCMCVCGIGLSDAALIQSLTMIGTFFHHFHLQIRNSK